MSSFSDASARADAVDGGNACSSNDLEHPKYQIFDSLAPDGSVTIASALTYDEQCSIFSWMPEDFTNGSPSLLFSSCIHGKTSTSFHEICDGKSPTLTIARTSDDLVVGGFTSLAWATTSRDVFFPDPSAFLFFKRDGILTQGTRTGREQEKAICHTNPMDYGPAFGYDLYFDRSLNMSVWDHDKVYTFSSLMGGGSRSILGMEVWLVEPLSFEPK